MTTRRRYCRVTVLDNCIYALGGFDSNNYQVLVMFVIITLRTTNYNTIMIAVLGGEAGPAGGPVGGSAEHDEQTQQLRRGGAPGQPLLRRRQRRDHVSTGQPR